MWWWVYVAIGNKKKLNGSWKSLVFWKLYLIWLEKKREMGMPNGFEGLLR
jgi:hypothetical protein